MTATSVALSKERKSDTVRTTLFSRETTETVLMGIKPEMFAEITKSLTDIYQYPLQSAIREVVSNALDASDDVVEITLPTSWRPQLTVEDHGVGMSRTTVAEIYSQYGSSTKKNDLTSIGAFGAGAKAPLAYTTIFSGSTVHQGLQTDFTVTRGEGLNELKMEPTVQTDRPDGTKITLPIKETDLQTVSAILSGSFLPYDCDRRLLVKGLCETPGKVFDEKWVRLDEVEFEDESTGEHFALPIYGVKELAKTASYDNTWVKLSGDAMSFTIGSFGYTGGGGGYRSDSMCLVALLPGLVNFPTSRETITQDERLDFLIKAVVKKVKDYYISSLVYIEKILPLIADEITPDDALYLASRYGVEGL